jgi:hypothetical protein
MMETSISVTTDPRRLAVSVPRRPKRQVRDDAVSGECNGNSHGDADGCQQDDLAHHERGMLWAV